MTNQNQVDKESGRCNQLDDKDHLDEFELNYQEAVYQQEYKMVAYDNVSPLRERHKNCN